MSAVDTVLKFFTNTTASSLADFLVDLPEGKTLQDIINLYTSIIANNHLQTSLNEYFKNQNLSLDETVKGKDESTTTFGEQIESKAPTVEDVD